MYSCFTLSVLQSVSLLSELSFFSVKMCKFALVAEISVITRVTMNTLSCSKALWVDSGVAMELPECFTLPWLRTVNHN